MSEPWNISEPGRCPKCQSDDWNPSDEGSFPSCNDCGFVLYDDWTLGIMEETRREFDQAKREYWPEPVPSYPEYLEAQRRKL